MEDKDKVEIHSQRIKAGKRTYFFDIKATKSNDYYLTITESKKKLKEGGEGFFYEKHKIFLYKEDFTKFIEALQVSMQYMKDELIPDYDFAKPLNETEEEAESDLKWE